MWMVEARCHRVIVAASVDDLQNQSAAVKTVTCSMRSVVDGRWSISPTNFHVGVSRCQGKQGDQQLTARPRAHARLFEH